MSAEKIYVVEDIHTNTAVENNTENKTDNTDSAGTIYTATPDFDLNEALFEFQHNEQKFKKEISDQKEINARQALEFEIEKGRLVRKIADLESRSSNMEQVASLREEEYVKSTTDIVDNYFNGQNRVLSEQLEDANFRYEMLVKKYDELFHYCEALVDDANDKVKKVEAENARLTKERNEMNEELQSETARFARTEKTYLEMVDERSASFEAAIREFKIQITNLTNELNEVRTDNAVKEKKMIEIEKFKAEKLVEVQKLQQTVQIIQGNAQRSKTVIQNMHGNMLDLKTSMDSVVTSVTKSKEVSQLSIKALNALLEQWNIEIEQFTKVTNLL